VAGQLPAFIGKLGELGERKGREDHFDSELSPISAESGSVFRSLSEPKRKTEALQKNSASIQNIIFGFHSAGFYLLGPLQFEKLRFSSLEP
jgi:hypothetical protein